MEGGDGGGYRHSGRRVRERKREGGGERKGTDR